MQFHCNHFSLRIPLREYSRLAAWRRTAIQDSLAETNQQPNQLRSLIFNRDLAIEKRLRTRHIS
jgi:hypothetical protein